MRNAVQRVGATALAVLGSLLLGGCPVSPGPGDLIAGGTGDTGQIRSEASVRVLTPAATLSITGGTQVEVNWQAFGTTRFAVLDVFFDVDRNASNGNEIVALGNRPLTETSALLDTTQLLRGTYFVGVRVKEAGAVVAFGYAPGQVVIDQRPSFRFTTDSVRESTVSDRSNRIVLTFDVRWEFSDPDSTNTVRVYLDPDRGENVNANAALGVNGNEILLYTSAKAPDADGVTRDGFTFDLPPASFPPGRYRILAIVSDGNTSIPFYAPGVITLRSRLSGYIDLRFLDLPSSPVRGAIFEGFNPRDNAGSLVASAKDFDGDGFGDFMIVAQFGKPRYQLNFQRVGLGEAYLIYGRRKPFSGVNNLNSTGTLFRGEVFGGVSESPDPIRPTRGITSFVVLSDMNGDGAQELAFGLPFVDSVPQGFLDPAGYFRTGGVVVVSGSVFGPFSGQNYIPLGEVGTITPAPGPPEPVYCPEGFVGAKAPSSPLGWTLFNENYGVAVLESRLGMRISTAVFGDQCGESLSTYPFFFGGTHTALVISCPGRDPTRMAFVDSRPGAGTVSIYYHLPGYNLWDIQSDELPEGGPFHYILDDRTYPRFALAGYYTASALDDPCDQRQSNWTPFAANTARLYGEFAGAAAGNAVGISDFNADGLPDLLVGSPLAFNGRGACYIVLGRFPDLVKNTDLGLEELSFPMNAGGTQRAFDGIRVIGAPGDRLGESHDDAGDFNGDGIADVIIGLRNLNNRRGGAAVFFGSRTAINLTEDEIPFDEIASRRLGVIFRGETAGDLAGARVSNAGDVDGDGNSDVLIAAPSKNVTLDLDLDGVTEIDRAECGVVYLIYGSSDLARRSTPGNPPGVFDLAYCGTEHLPGAVFIGRRSGDQLGAALGDQADRGRSIAHAGDIDGDGFADLLLGSSVASPRNRTAAGEVYLIYGLGD